MPLDNLTLEGVRITMRNFGGRKMQYNDEGHRNFLVLLTEEMADRLKRDGWNVKYFKVREEEEIPQAFLKVNVNYDARKPPRVVMITSRNKTTLDEAGVSVLDVVDIINVDMIIRPYERKDNIGGNNISAYLQSIYVTIVEDELELKYADVDNSTEEEEPARVAFQ